MTKAVAFEVVEAALDVACQSNDDLRSKEYLPCHPHIQARPHRTHPLWTTTALSDSQSSPLPAVSG